MWEYEKQLDSDFNWALEQGSLHFESRSAVHDTMRRLVKALDELNVDYAIAGAMAMFLHGYQRFTQGVDVIVTADGLAVIYNSLVGKGYIRCESNARHLRDVQTGVKVRFLTSGNHPIAGKPGPVLIPVPCKTSVDCNGIRVLTLPKLVELKMASGQASHRLSDVADVQRMIQFLNLPRDFADQLDPSLRDAYQRLWQDAQTAAAEEY